MATKRGQKKDEERNLIIVCPVPSKKAVGIAIGGLIVFIGEIPWDAINISSFK